MSIKSRADFFRHCTSRAELALVLGTKPRTLNYLSFAKIERYKSFLIPKKNGGKREIHAPIGALKVLQKRLAEILNHIYPAPSYVYGFIPQRSIVQNATPHIDKRVVLNFDLKDFFPSITASRLIAFFKAPPFNFNNEIVSTIVRLLCHNDALPPGAPTSPVVANMICFRMDRALNSFAKREGADYTRYADDITFSTRRSKLSTKILKKNKEGLLVLGDEILSIINSNYFSINDLKTRVSYGKKAQYVTGIKVNTKANVSKVFTREIRSILNAWSKYHLPDTQKRFESKYGGKGKDIVAVVRGKLAHLKNVKGPDDKVYSRLYNRFVELEGKGRARLPENEEERLFERVFVIQCGSKKGTAFILNQKFLITCNHVVLETEDIEFFAWDQCLPIAPMRAKIKRKYTSQDLDLAFIEIDNSNLLNTKSLFAVGKSESIRPADKYKALGFPNYRLNMKPRITPVTVTALEKDKYGTSQISVIETLVSGNSGGPVLNSKNQVVGVVALGAPNPLAAHDWSGFSFIPIQEVRRFAETISLNIDS